MLFSEKEWKRIYSNVFCLFPSPEDLDVTIKYKKDNKVFYNNLELASYFYTKNITEVTEDDLEYIINDKKFKSKIENQIENIIKRVSKN